MVVALTAPQASQFATVSLTRDDAKILTLSNPESGNHSCGVGRDTASPHHDTQWLPVPCTPVQQLFSCSVRGTQYVDSQTVHGVQVYHVVN